jgi:hypothetical protein
MATKVITICDWHEGDVEAAHHNEWTNPTGVRRSNDLCEEDQKKFLKAWEAIEKNSSVVQETAVRPTRRKVSTSRNAGPSQQAIIKAWARENGYSVSETGGRVPFNIEMEWKKAGSPNLLAE